jgi:hypothetical protein
LICTSGAEPQLAEGDPEAAAADGAGDSGAGDRGATDCAAADDSGVGARADDDGTGVGTDGAVADGLPLVDGPPEAGAAVGWPMVGSKVHVGGGAPAHAASRPISNTAHVAIRILVTISPASHSASLR